MVSQTFSLLTSELNLKIKGTLPPSILMVLSARLKMELRDPGIFQA